MTTNKKTIVGYGDNENGDNNEEGKIPINEEKNKDGGDIAEEIKTTKENNNEKKNFDEGNKNPATISRSHHHPSNIINHHHHQSSPSYLQAKNYHGQDPKPSLTLSDDKYRGNQLQMITEGIGQGGKEKKSKVIKENKKEFPGKVS